jgi:decaprenylphospho-beta-D-ribofuranose 2-oxidase
MSSRESTLHGWGLHAAPGREVRAEDLEAITRGAVLSRGLGRSYGDSSLPPPGVREVVGTVLADRVLAFDTDTGVLRAEAGLSLFELNRLLLPRGWFTPVTPGTQFVTLGGMVASDIHGKNHHTDGCFGEHVTALRLRLADGRVVECSPTDNPELLDATIGGMGLTGHILEVGFTMRRVPSPWIWQESTRVPNIEAYVESLKRAGPDWPMTVGWIDCVSGGANLGRGILMRGRWATPDEAPRHFPRQPRRLTMPFHLPGWVLNRASVLAFNTAFYWKHLPREKRGIVSPWSFFYPLDAILHWNRLYGRRGFTQYQCVLPEASGASGARRFLELLTRLGGASFLCVIKDCGPEGRGLLSFPMPGISIALDIPMRDWTQRVIDELNAFVIAEGGRIYLTKDTISRPEHFAAMEPRLECFLAYRRELDPDHTIRSAQSVRMFGDRSPSAVSTEPLP